VRIDKRGRNWVTSGDAQSPRSHSTVASPAQCPLGGLRPVAPPLLSPLASLPGPPEGAAASLHCTPTASAHPCTLPVHHLHVHAPGLHDEGKSPARARAPGRMLPLLLFRLCVARSSLLELVVRLADEAALLALLHARLVTAGPQGREGGAGVQVRANHRAELIPRQPRSCSACECSAGSATARPKQRQAGQGPGVPPRHPICPALTASISSTPSHRSKSVMPALAARAASFLPHAVAANLFDTS
jgi:hypothetical protein